MAFQNTVNRVNTFGIQGDLANGQIPHYTPTTPRVAAQDTGVSAGSFVWVADNNGVATASSTGTGIPTGIVQRTLDGVNYDITSEGTLTFKEGRKVDVIVWGDVFVKTTDTAVVGNVLFVNNTTGAITNKAAGSTVSGASETGWVIKSLANNATASAGSVVIASNVK